MRTETIYLAGGCFWGTQHYLDLLYGVQQTEVGYANGNTANPSYEDVKHRGTGHAETVKVVFDADAITLTDLLEQFFHAINPVSVNQQGEDKGVQYRTGVYYEDPAQEPVIRAALAKLQERYTEPLAVECLPLQAFYRAEEYHQDYLVKNPTGYCHLSPALFAAAQKWRREGK